MLSEGGYRGRFAPSPSGPLHFGSLVTAVASWLDARSHSGVWLLRIDDLDPPRVVPGVADGILRSLERFALHWDEAVMYQSQRSPAYAAAIQQLQHAGSVFPCHCSRKQLAAHGMQGHEGPIHAGACIAALETQRPAALRLRCGDAVVAFQDAIQPAVQDNLASAYGDFVLQRADGVAAYHLAVVVDDASMGITHVVRGSDLLGSTSRQIWLQQQLNLPTPCYAHLPLAVAANGCKLSKASAAGAIDALPVGATLLAALQFLGLHPPATLGGSSPTELLAWATPQWDIKRLASSNQTAPAWLQ